MLSSNSINAPITHTPSQLCKTIGMAAIFIGSFSPAHADTPIESGAQRINLASKTAALSAQVSATVCQVQIGMANTDDIAAFIDILDQITAALSEGDAALGLSGQEFRVQTIQAIDRVADASTKMRANLATGSDDLLSEMIVASYQLQLEVPKLISELSSQYTDANNLQQADAFQIDVAARQRTTLAQMSTNLCLMTAGVAADDPAASLAANIASYEQIQTVLLRGMSSMGLASAPTPKIAAQLESVASSWATAVPLFEGDYADASAALTALSGEMDLALTMYVAHFAGEGT